MLEVCNQLVVLTLEVMATSNHFPMAINKEWFILLMGEWDAVVHVLQNLDFKILFSLPVCK